MLYILSHMQFTLGRGTLSPGPILCKKNQHKQWIPSFLVKINSHYRTMPGLSKTIKFFPRDFPRWAPGNSLMWLITGWQVLSARHAKHCSVSSRCTVVISFPVTLWGGHCYRTCFTIRWSCDLRSPSQELNTCSLVPKHTCSALIAGFSDLPWFTS